MKMSEDKQIEEMAFEICKRRAGNNVTICENCRNHGCCLYEEIASALFDAGYRKQSEIEKLENKLFFDALESVFFSLVYLGADGKWHTKRNNAEKTTTIIERYKELVVKMKGGEG